MASRARSSLLRKVGEIDPMVGRYLTATVRTGTFCSYQPDPGNSLLAGLTVQP
jgi:hypothetical protein